jgi:hypothetical protein
MVLETDKLIFGGDPLKYIEWVCIAFLSKYGKEIGFSENLIELIIFLLCFTEPLKVWILLGAIYRKMIP